MHYEREMSRSVGRTALLAALPPEFDGDVKSVQALFHTYTAAMKVVSVRMDIMNAEFQTLHDHNPIHHTESRIKSMDSILEKLERKDLEPTLQNIRDYITDVAGLRIVCHYVDDIYLLDRLLAEQDNVEIIRRTDYIEHPKPNGYRSLHLIVRVPVPLAERTDYAPVEIQLRTIAMDMWASLEHELHYKSRFHPVEHLSERLKMCANTLSDVDLRMQEIFDYLNGDRDGSEE